MKKYWIDFSGYCLVRAKTEDQAVELAYKQLTFHNTADIDNITFNVEGEGIDPIESEDENNV